MRPGPRSRHLLALAMLLGVSVAGGFSAAKDERLAAPQANTAATALKRHDQTLFATDPILGASGLWRFDPPVLQAVLELMLVPTGYDDPTFPFRVLAPLAVMVFLCGMYALLYRQCRSWSVSVFVAVLSLAVIHSPGGWDWGLGPLATITPAGLYLAVMPFIVLAFLRYAGQWRVALVFGFVGLMGNVHLVTAMNLTIVLLIVYLGLRRFEPAAWPAALGCGLCALAGALPYLWYFLALRLGAQAGPWPSYGTLKAAFAIVEMDVFYPGVLSAMLRWRFLGPVLVLGISAGAVLSRIERFRVRDMRAWALFLIACAAVGFVLHGASQLVGLWGAAPPVPDFIQAVSLMLLPLYVLFAQALTNLFRMVRVHRRQLRWACAALLAVWIIPSDNFRVARHGVYEIATAFIDEADKPHRVLRLRARRDARRELALIGRAVRDHTDPTAAFLADRVEFRMLARRAIVAGPGDLKYLYHLAPWGLGDWTRRIRRQELLLDPKFNKADTGAMAGFVGELAGQEQFRGVKRWYVLMKAKVVPDKSGVLKPVEPASWGLDAQSWGKHYRLYELARRAPGG